MWHPAVGCGDDVCIESGITLSDPGYRVTVGFLRLKIIIRAARNSQSAFGVGPLTHVGGGANRGTVVAYCTRYLVGPVRSKS